MPAEGEALDYHPPNIYVPTKVPEPFMAERNQDDPIGIPIQIQTSGEETICSDIWFK